MGLAAEARGEGRGYRGRTYLWGGGCVHVLLWAPRCEA